MVRKTPIRCPHCSELTGFYEEDFMYRVITSNILCPHCGDAVIYANGGIEYNNSLHNPNVYTPPQNININTNLDIE